MKKKLIVILSIIFVSLVIIGFVVLNAKRVNIQRSDCNLYSTDKEFIDACEYVFVGKIKNEAETKQYDGTGVDIPYTIYNLEIVEYLKGTGDKEGRICFCGGKLYLNTWSLYSENDEILQKNKYYLFFTNKANEANKRLKKDDYILYQNQQKILLEEYDSSKSLSAQNQSISQTISRYKNVIDKVMEYDLGLPTLETVEEIVQAYNTIFIWTASESLDRSNENPKENIAIPQVFYKINITELLKETESLKDIRYISFVGVNYWYDENPVGFGVPKQNHTYLLFGNASNDTIKIESRQQIIELVGYDINKEYSKQTDEIKEIVQSYIDFLD